MKVIIASLGVVLLLVGLNVAIGWTFGGDSEWYVAAAQGNWHELIPPYAGRFLHPFLVGVVNRVTSLDITQSFLVIALVAVYFFFITTGALLKKTIRTPLLLIPLFVSPFFFNTVREAFEPDALYLCLMALFFFSMRYKKDIESMVTLFLLFLARESTLVLSGLCAVVGFFKNKKWLVVAVALVTVAGLYTTSIIKSVGKPNPSGGGGAAYLALKLSYNLATNVFGVRPWSNTVDNCTPVVRFNLPQTSVLGDMHEAGWCAFDPALPLKTLVILLTIFGVAPLVLGYVLVKWKGVLQIMSFPLAVALTYGIAMYGMGVVAGTGIERIVGYGWPAFILVAPILVASYFEIRRQFVIKLAVAQLVVSWLPLVVYRMGGDGALSSLLILAVTGIMYGFVYRLMNREKRCEEVAGKTTLVI